MSGFGLFGGIGFKEFKDDRDKSRRPCRDDDDRCRPLKRVRCEPRKRPRCGC